jgi:hypothetical protein
LLNLERQLLHLLAKGGHLLPLLHEVILQLIGLDAASILGLGLLAEVAVDLPDLGLQLLYPGLKFPLPPGIAVAALLCALAVLRMQRLASIFNLFSVATALFRKPYGDLGIELVKAHLASVKLLLGPYDLGFHRLQTLELPSSFTLPEHHGRLPLGQGALALLDLQAICFQLALR